MRGSPSTIMCVGGGTWLRSHWDQQCPGDASGASRQVPAEVPVRRVLLLNVTYEPLTTVGLRRAVCLVLCEKAEIVHHDSGGQLLHSSSISRAALMRRDNYKCAYCGRRAETIDHVIPRSRGGQHTWENCVASCTICNHRKADRLLEELGWTLPVAPAVPRGAHWRLIGAQYDGDPQWETYLGAISAA